MEFVNFKELTDTSRNNNCKKLSAVMPVYNSEEFLNEAINSVLRQSFSDFEFIILDDGSTDNSLSILMKYASLDNRIRVISCEQNIGLVQIRNLGLQLTNCELYITIDSDDISLPMRFAVQLDFMEKHPECIAAGANCAIISPYNDFLYNDNLPIDHQQIYSFLLKGDGSIIKQPAAIHRTKYVRLIGGYRCAGAEDLDLYLRLAEIGKIANIPEILVQYRQHLNSSNHASWERNFNARKKAIEDAYMRTKGRIPNDLELLPYEKPSITECLERWGWAALRSMKVKTARSIAKQLLIASPFSFASWRFLYCSLRGY